MIPQSKSNNSIQYVNNALAKLRLSEKGSYLLQDPARVVFTEGITWLELVSHTY